jgi:ribosomal protein S18 acetylase RimI-like enzyme
MLWDRCGWRFITSTSRPRPQLAPFVRDDEMWRVRRVLYEELLAKSDTLLLLAYVGDAAVGYGLAHVLPVDETWIPDTWKTSSRIGEIKSLSVLTDYRGSGLGSELLNRLEQHLSAIGVKDLMLGAYPATPTPSPVRAARLSTDLALPVAV